MNRNIIIIISVFLIFVLIATFVVCTAKIMSLKNKQDESLAPIGKTDELEIDANTFNEFLNFSVYRDDGTLVELNEYENNPLVIMFFDDQDSKSIENLDIIEEAYKSYKNKIKFLMINTNPEKKDELINKYTIPIYYDSNKEGVKKYNITEMPHIIYINEINEIFNTKTGVTTEDALLANLDLLTDNI